MHTSSVDLKILIKIRFIGLKENIIDFQIVIN